MQNVILVDIIDYKISKKEALEGLIELENLVNTFGGFVVIKKIQKKSVPDYETYIGKGKLEEVRLDAINLGSKLIIINNNLKPKQIYNVERYLEKDKIKVWTRIDLILKIFEKHAVTQESRLQIELAAITQMGPRIFGMGFELSRQGGGIGTRGQGETNTEIMKRHLFTIEKKIKERLEKIGKRHELYRQSRERKGLKTVAIVGYTNAGKSQTLFSLTQKNVKIKDELFATLDTRIGDFYLPNIGEKCLVSDTIGFIKDLPPSLIDAFKSTLDETIHADIILHVLDFSDPKKEKKLEVVNKILEELHVFDKPILLVCNKIDLIKDVKFKAFFKKYKKYNPTLYSALRKEGINELKQKIEFTLSNTN